MTEQQNLSQPRVPELDGVRGIAILLVLIWHYVAVTVPLDAGPFALPLRLVLSAAWSGVDLFFVLSGYLIGGILLDNRSTPNYFKAFYARRTCRIMPVYYVWLGLFVLFYNLPAIWASNPALVPLFAQPQPIWTYATYTQNIAMAQSDLYGAVWLSITWSLAIEEQFYLVLPLLVRLTAARWLPAILLAIIAGTPVTRAALLTAYPQAELPTYVLTICRTDALLLGVLAAYVMRHAGWRQRIAQHRPVLYVAALLLWFSLALMAVTPASQTTGIIWGYSGFALMYVCLLLIALTERRGPVSAVVRIRPLRALGIMAYGVYLFHQPINGLWHALSLQQTPILKTPADALVTLAALLTTLTIAYLSWNYFEQRFVNIGRKVSYH
ncbi:O-acetyltransferase OatA [Thermoflexales bacterium]|nr:O-acetyltransferase OatA [Thermoflexales bacterium]